LEILIRAVSHEWKYCLLPNQKKKLQSVKQADLREMFKKACKKACTSTIVISPDPLSPVTSTYSARKTPENR